MRAKTIAIIGGGPAGCTLATLLTRQGHNVGLFQTKKRPALIVGESLLPAVVPFLKLLGVEEKVRQFSTFKPGATIRLTAEEELSFGFDLARSPLSYAYNVPRNLFDQTLLEAARESGTKIFDFRATIELDEKTGKPQLSTKTVEASEGFFSDKVDLIIDASGRSRLLPQLLNLPSSEGKRRDLALFSHLENVQIQDPGNIHVDRFNLGWGWRIPLPGRVSLGIVVDPKHLATLGKTVEEQYEGFLKIEPTHIKNASQASRITPVMSYTNYQWKAKQLFGEGWALAGDSAGFIDPVFSTGLYLSMFSAVRLAEAIGKDSSNAMKQYEKRHLAELTSWQSIIDIWYDGKLFTLFRMGKDYKHTLVGKILNRHITKHVTRIFTGEIRPGSYSHRLLNFMTKYGLRDKDTSPLVIR